MAKVPVFYSFHFANDCFRVQMVRNIGALEGDEPVTANEWEEVKRKGPTAVERWIDEHMRYKRCVIVLVGSETANRPWVKYEIVKAWNDGKGLFGIHIHNLKCARTESTCPKGPNPFDQIEMQDGSRLSSQVMCYDPSSLNAYAAIQRGMEQWVANAIAAAGRRF